MSISAQDKELLKRLALAEARSEGVVGMALVIRSVLNRREAIRAGANFNTRSTNIRDIIYAPNQYQPVGDSRNSIDQSFSTTQLSNAEKAFQLAKNPAELQRSVQSDGVSATNARGLVLSNGFDSLGGQGRPDAITYRGHTFTDNINNFGVTGDSIYAGSVPSTSSPTSSSSTQDESNNSSISESITIPRPEKLGPEAIKISNEIIAQQDVIAKFKKDNEGTAYAQWSDELKAEYNNELNKLAELDEKLIRLAKTDASANCLAREFIGKPMSLPGTPNCATIQGTVAYGKILDDLLKPVDLPDPCGKSDLSKINSALLKFFNDLKAIRKFGETYVNGAFNEIYRITNLVRNTASIIGSVLKGIMQNLRNWLLDKIRKGIQLIIDNLFPTLAKQFKNTIIGQIVDNILCAFKDIIKNLGSLVGDFLFELIGKIVNVPLCAVQQFTNGLINNVVAKVDEALGPVLDSINDLLGGIGKIVGSVFEALDFILGFEAYLCQKPNCPEIKSTVLGPWANSPNKPFGDGFDNFIDNAEKDFSEEGIQKYVDGLSIFGGKLGDLADAPESSFPCDTNPLKCGPPSIEIFGGGGIGAVGKAVINDLGQIYGVNIENGGSGYSKPPFVSIIDPCDNGRGASGYAVIDYKTGQVVDIPIITHGYGYPNRPTGRDEFGNLIDPTSPGAGTPGGGTPGGGTPGGETPGGGTPGSGTPGSGTPGGGGAITGPDRGVIIGSDRGVNDYIVCLEGFDIISTGIGYSQLDRMIITPDLPNLEASVRMTEAGQIISITLTERVCGLTDIPTITIESPTGEGAKIRPKFSFIKITDDIDEELPPQTILPIDRTTASDESIADLAQRNVVRVIDCVGNTPPVVGYVNGQPYSGPFHVHPSKGVKMVGAFHISGYHDTIYDTAEESLNKRGRSTEPSTPTPTTSQTPASTPRPRPTPAPRPAPAPRSTPTPTPSPSPSPPPSGGGGYGGGY